MNRPPHPVLIIPTLVTKKLIGGGGACYVCARAAAGVSRIAHSAAVKY